MDTRIAALEELLLNNNLIIDGGDSKVNTE
jgi:hypothetical protein